MATELALVQKRLTDALGKLEPKAAKPTKKATAAAAPAHVKEKKPLTGYMRFCDEERKANPTQKLQTRNLAEQWRALTDAQKAIYKV